MAAWQICKDTKDIHCEHSSCHNNNLLEKMTTDSATELSRFLEKSVDSAELQERLGAARDLHGVISIANDSGYSIDANEIGEDDSEDSELTAEQLKNVSGGWQLKALAFIASNGPKAAKFYKDLYDNVSNGDDLGPAIVKAGKSSGTTKCHEEPDFGEFGPPA